MNILYGRKRFPSLTTLGIGLTNRCNLNCDHCYSRKMAEKSIGLADIEKILRVFPSLKSVNFGTGESILNLHFEEIVDMLWRRGIKLAVTSNGLTVNRIKEETLKKFDDVDISIDFPDPKKHDEWRKRKGLFNEAIKAIKRCKKYRINVSIVSVLMSNNYDQFRGFKPILDKYDINLRINLYKPVNKDEFTPSYEQFWAAIDTMGRYLKVVSCSEPVLAPFWPDLKGGSKCGNSLRIHPNGSISSCVYVNDGQSPAAFNLSKKILPEFCRTCLAAKRCQGGCYGRRLLEGRGELPDQYCPYANGRELPKIKFKKYGQGKSLIHSDYLCTIILR